MPQPVTSLIRAGLIVASLVLLGRIAGFGREWLIAAKAGASEASDIAIVLLTFPDLMVSLLLSGGLAAALIPAFKRLEDDQARSLFMQVARLIGLIFCSLAGVLAVFASTVLAGLAPGLASTFTAQYTDTFRLVLVALPLAALSGVTVAMLNSQEQFISGAAGTLVFNLTVIGFLLFANPNNMVTAIALGVAAGSLLRLAMQLSGLRHNWHWPSMQPRLLDGALFKRFFASFSFLTLLVMLPPIARAFSSYEDAGSLSLFNYAHKLVELPMGVVIGSLITVLLPRLAADFSQSSMAAAQASLSAGIRAALMLSIGIAIPVVFFADTFVRLAFFNAAFTPAQIDNLAQLTTIGFMALPFQSLLNIYGTAFAAHGHTRPLVTSALTMLLTIFMVAPSARAAFGIEGIMLAYSGVYVLGTLLLTLHARIHFGMEVLYKALQKPFKTLIVPAVFAFAVGSIGHAVSTDLAARTCWAMASFSAFILSTVWLDPSLRQTLLGFRQRNRN